MGLVGRLDQDGEGNRFVLFPIVLLSEDGDEILEDALFDTGFTKGHIALHEQDIDFFGWPVIEPDKEVDTAGGSRTVTIYRGKFLIDNQVLELDVYVTDLPERDRILLGMGLLDLMNLTIDTANDVYRLDWKF